MTRAVAYPQPRIRKRLPAYGRELLTIRENGLAPAGPWIAVCLDSWDWGKTCARCVIPPDLDPAQTDFNFITGLYVVLVYERGLTAPERIDATIRELVKCQPSGLQTLDARPTVKRLESGEFDDDHDIQWIISRQVGLEKLEYAS